MRVLLFKCSPFLCCFETYFWLSCHVECILKMWWKHKLKLLPTFFSGYPPQLFKLSSRDQTTQRLFFFADSSLVCWSIYSTSFSKVTLKVIMGFYWVQLSSSVESLDVKTCLAWSSEHLQDKISCLFYGLSLRWHTIFYAKSHCISFKTQTQDLTKAQCCIPFHVIRS